MTDLAKVQSTVQTVFQETSAYLQVANVLQVQTAEHEQQAAWLINALADKQKYMETERDSVTKPLKQAAAQVTSWWKPGIDACKQAIVQLKTAVQQRRAIVAEQQRAALSEARSHDEIRRAQQAMAPAPEGLSEREHWHAEVTDKSKIPLEYWMLDTSKLNAMARLHKEKLAIPGVRPVREMIVTRKG